MSEPISTLPVETAQTRLALRPREAAQLLGISARLLWSMTNQNLIPHFRIGRRVAYSPDALRAWIAEQTKATK